MSDLFICCNDDLIYIILMYSILCVNILQFCSTVCKLFWCACVCVVFECDYFRTMLKIIICICLGAHARARVCVCIRARVGKGGGEKGDMLCYI